MKRSTEDDPRRFVAGFRASSAYTVALERFFRGKQLEPDVTQDEKREVFEQSDAAKIGLIAYARDDTALRFNPRRYAHTTVAAIDAYVDYVRFARQRMEEGPDRDEIAEMDGRRSKLHGVAAQALVTEGIAPNEKLGRALARLILVDLGLDTYASAQETDITRIERVRRGAI